MKNKEINPIELAGIFRSRFMHYDGTNDKFDPETINTIVHLDNWFEKYNHQSIFIVTSELKHGFFGNATFHDVLGIIDSVIFELNQHKHLFNLPESK